MAGAGGGVGPAAAHPTPRLLHPGPQDGTPALPRSPQGYIYVEAHKETHAKEALRGLRMIFASRPPKLVPLREMVDALAVAGGTERAIGEGYSCIH